jgi:hypothetical protein
MDLQDFNHTYYEGDIFPRSGLKVSDERLNELAGSQNKQGEPLIELVGETEDREEKVYTKTEINRMPITDLKELASKNGIENAEELTGAELKKILIEKFEL